MTNYVLQTSESTGDVSKPFLIRDDLLEGAGFSVKCLFDYGFGWSYPAGNLPRPAPTAPVNSAVTRDVSLNKNDGYAVRDTEETMTFTSDYGIRAVATLTHQVEYGASIFDGVYAGFSQNTNWLLCVYMKPGLLSNWPTSGAVTPFVSSSEFGENYTNGVEHVFIGQGVVNNGLGTISVRVQDSIGSAKTITHNLPTGQGLYDDNIVQLAVWFDGANVHSRVKSVSYESTLSQAFSGNTEDVTPLSLGFVTSKGNFNGSTGTQPPSVHRGFLENITESGRNPVTVLDEDLTRVLARGVFN